MFLDENSKKIIYEVFLSHDFPTKWKRFFHPEDL